MDRLSPVEKHAAAERLIDLCAQALRLRHPQSRSFRYLTPSTVRTWPDARVLAAISTMEAWISEQPPLPIHPDSYLARKGV